MAAAFTEPFTDAERAVILNRVIARLARQGWQISAVLAGQAIAQRRQSLVGDKRWTIVVFTIVCRLTPAIVMKSAVTTRKPTSSFVWTEARILATQRTRMRMGVRLSTAAAWECRQCPTRCASWGRD